MTERNIFPIAVSVRDAAKMIGLSHTSVYTLINEGKIKAVKFGTRTLIPVANLHAFLNSLADA